MFVFHVSTLNKDVVFFGFYMFIMIPNENNHEEFLSLERE